MIREGAGIEALHTGMGGAVMRGKIMVMKEQWGGDDAGFEGEDDVIRRWDHRGQ